MCPTRNSNSTSVFRRSVQPLRNKIFLFHVIFFYNNRLFVYLFPGKSFNGCKRAHSAGYVRGAAALVVIAFLTDFFGTLLTGLGLRSTDPNKKYKYYRVAIYSLGVAILALFLALIIYPTSMTKDMEAGKSVFCLHFFLNFT